MAGKLTKWMRRNFRCRFGMCPCQQAGDDVALWAECILCGKRSAYTTRAAIRRIIEAEEAEKQFRERRALAAKESAGE